MSKKGPEEEERTVRMFKKKKKKANLPDHRTTYLTKYLGHTLLMNHNHDDVSRSYQKITTKNTKMPPLCIR